MKVEIHNVNGKRLGFVFVDRQTALLLIESLTRQLITKSPNEGRLESFCQGDLDEFTIAVTGDR